MVFVLHIEKKHAYTFLASCKELEIVPYVVEDLSIGDYIAYTVDVPGGVTDILYLGQVMGAIRQKEHLKKLRKNN
jgi:hypothetical protein